MSELVSASLDYYRALRDAASEAAFFQTYGNMFSLYLADKHEAERARGAGAADPRELPFVKEALASIERRRLCRGARARRRTCWRARASRCRCRGCELQAGADEGLRASCCPTCRCDQWRRVRGEQEIIVRYEPEQAIATLPELLADRADRERLLTLLDRLLADERMQRVKPSTEQLAMLQVIGGRSRRAAAGSRRASSGAVEPARRRDRRRR